MATPTIIRRELSHVKLYFIPEGDTVDAVAVAQETWPNNEPTTNYTDYSVNDIETAVHERTVTEQVRMVPGENGGYVEDPEELVTKRLWRMTTAKTNAIFKQLEYGLAAVPADGVGQEIGTKHDNYVQGVAKLDIYNRAGTLIETVHIWARIRISNPGDIGPDTRAIEFTVEQRYSSLNDYTPHVA